MFRRILLLALAAFLALMPVTTAYAGDGDNNRDREFNNIEINFEDLDEEDLDINFEFRPFRLPRAEIEIAPGVEIEVPFFTGLGFLLRRNLGALGLFNARRVFGLQNRFDIRNLRDRSILD